VKKPCPQFLKNDPDWDENSTIKKNWGVFLISLAIDSE
jgi:hypothetical protein